MPKRLKDLSAIRTQREITPEETINLNPEVVKPARKVRVAKKEESDDEILSRFEFSPTLPKEGDLPGFRAAFNKFLTEQKIPEHRFTASEIVFFKKWRDDIEEKLGVNIPIKVTILRPISPFVVVGPYKIRDKFPNGLKTGSVVVMPKFVAMHLVGQKIAMYSEEPKWLQMQT